MSLYDAYVKQRDRKGQAAETIIDSVEPIDWKEVIDHLRKCGFSFGKIASSVGVSHETVRGWYAGSVPNYEAGRKLLILKSAAGIPVASNELKGL